MSQLLIGNVKGPQGAKGDTGNAATIAVGTTTTLPAGSAATVTNSGTSSAAVFDFGIPKGEDAAGETFEGLIAPVEESPSTHHYDIGDPLIYDDVTYKAIAEINIGDTLTSGTNIQGAGSVMEIIQDLEAEDVAFDNLGTGMSATDVQGAVEEVNSSLSAEVTARTTLSNQLDRQYTLKTINNVSVTGDGTKTYKTLLNELMLAFRTYLTNNPDRYCQVVGLSLGSTLLSTQLGSQGLYHAASLPSVIDFLYGVVSGTGAIFLYSSINASLNGNQYSRMDVATSHTYTDNTNSVVQNTYKIILYFNEYKRVLV